MKISIYHKAFKVILSPMARILFVAGVLLSACADSEQAPPPVPEHTATLRLVFKQQGPAAEPSLTQLKGTDSFATDAPLTMDAGTTRAPLTRAVNETDIQTVDVLSFKVDAAEPNNIKKGTFFYRSKGVYTQLAPGQGRVEVKLIGSPEAQTLVVLANARTQVDALGATYGEQKETVMNRLTFDVATEAAPDFTNGIPMWGELPNEVVSEGFSPSGAPKEVTMIRSVAKFTLINPAETDPKGFFYYYNQLRLYNYRNKGRIAPDNYNTVTKQVDTPTVPAGARPPQGTFVQLNSEVSFERIGIYGGKQKSFYLCEVDNIVRPSGGNALDDLCLIMHVKPYVAPGKPIGDGYYRLDFKDYGPGGLRMDILRNHEYKIQIESVEGLPADTPEEAFKGNHTLKCRIVPWNQVQEEVKVPGNKRLTVDKRKVYIPLDKYDNGGELTISTANTGGWTIVDATPGIIVNKLATTADGTETINVNVKSKQRKGSFKIKAGNAEMEIKVKREGFPLDYVAEYNLAGGAQYGAKPNNLSLVTSAQTDPQLRWASDHNNDQSGYYNWYVLKGITQGTYNPNGKKLFDDDFFKPGHPGHGYHLPSRQELTGVFSYNGQATYGGSVTNTNPDINEACEFGGIKKTFGAAYTSSGNGVCYAIRFKQATGNPNDGSPLSDFPQATDNRMCCAYRYTRIGSFANDNNLNSQLKVDCVYLGEAGASTPIGTISNDAWWSARTSETVTRIFPAAGYIYPAQPSSSGTLYSRGHYGYYWSVTEYSSSHACYASFNSTYAGADYNYYKHDGFPVRLFARE